MSGYTTIVASFRVPGKPVVRYTSREEVHPPMLAPHVIYKPAHTPSPVGTVRGPWTCGKGSDPAGGVQFAVHCADGSWAPYTARRGPAGEKSARAQAEERAKREIEKHESQTLP